MRGGFGRRTARFECVGRLKDFSTGFTQVVVRERPARPAVGAPAVRSIIGRSHQGGVGHGLMEAGAHVHRLALVGAHGLTSGAKVGPEHEPRPT